MGQGLGALPTTAECCSSVLFVLPMGSLSFDPDGLLPSGLVALPAGRRVAGAAATSSARRTVPPHP